MHVDEQAVQNIISCVEEFVCYPFDAASSTLRTLQSAIPASPELIRDFSTARQDGESKLQSSMDNRLYAKEKSPYDRIKHSCRLTFVSSRDSKVTGEHVKLKQGEMESKTLSYVVKCVDESGLASLQEVTKHRLTEECLVLFNANGTFRKTQKSKLLQKLIRQPQDNIFHSGGWYGHDLETSCSYSGGQGQWWRIPTHMGWLREQDVICDPGAS